MRRIRRFARRSKALNTGGTEDHWGNRRSDTGTTGAKAHSKSGHLRGAKAPLFHGFSGGLKNGTKRAVF